MHPQSGYRQTRTEYVVSHHQNCGGPQILINTIGIFPTLENAQCFAQDFLNTVLNNYIAQRFCGYYHDQIDLQCRGLITGLTTSGDYVALSEVHIDAIERTFEPVQVQVYNGGQSLHANAQYYYAPSIPYPSNAGYYYNSTMHTTHPHLTATSVFPQPYTIDHGRAIDHSSPSRPNPVDMSTQPGAPTLPPQPQTTDTSPSGGTFSQTRPVYPDRPSVFAPRPTAQHDDTMAYSSPLVRFPQRRDEITPAQQLAGHPSKRRGKRRRHVRRTQSEAKEGEDAGKAMEGGA